MHILFTSWQRSDGLLFSMLNITRLSLIRLLLGCALGALLSSMAEAQSESLPTHEALERAIAIEVIERDPGRSLTALTDIALDSEMADAVRRHAWLRMGMLLQRVESPDAAWAQSKERAHLEALEHAARGSDMVAERAKELLEYGQVEPGRWLELERKAEALIREVLENPPSSPGDSGVQRSLVWIGRPAVGPMLRGLEQSRHGASSQVLMACLLQVDDPRVLESLIGWIDAGDPCLRLASFILPRLHQAKTLPSSYRRLIPGILKDVSRDNIVWSIDRGPWSDEELRRFSHSSITRLARAATHELVRRLVDSADEAGSEAEVDSDADSDSADNLCRDLKALFESTSPFLSVEGPRFLYENYRKVPKALRFLAQTLGDYDYKYPADSIGAIEADESDAVSRELLATLVARGREGAVGSAPFQSFRYPDAARSISTQIAVAATDRLQRSRQPGASMPGEVFEYLAMDRRLARIPADIMAFASSAKDGARAVEILLSWCPGSSAKVLSDHLGSFEGGGWNMFEIVLGLNTWQFSEPLPDAVWNQLGSALQQYVGGEERPFFFDSSNQRQHRHPNYLSMALDVAAKTRHPEVADWFERLIACARPDLTDGLVNAAIRYHQGRQDDRSRSVKVACLGLRVDFEGGLSKLRASLYADPAVDWVSAVAPDVSAWENLNLQAFRPSARPGDSGPSLGNDELAAIWDVLLGRALEAGEFESVLRGLLSVEDSRLPAGLEQVVFRRVDEVLSDDVVEEDVLDTVLQYLSAFDGDLGLRRRYARLALAAMRETLDRKSTEQLDDAEGLGSWMADPWVRGEDFIIRELLEHVGRSAYLFECLQQHGVVVPRPAIEAVLKDDDRVGRYLNEISQIDGQDSVSIVNDYVLMSLDRIALDGDVAKVAWAALDACSRFGDPSSIPALLAVHRQVQSLRPKAREILDQIRFGLEQERFWKSLTDGGPDLRPERVATDLVAQGRPNQPKAVRLLAIQSLGALGRPEALGELIRWSQEEDADVKSASRAAIERIVERDV